MTEIDYWNYSKVTYVDHMGSDNRVVEAAKTSTQGEASLGSEGKQGFIKFLLRADPPHISPFEHCVATFLIEAPLFVAAQLHTHKSFSFNQESGRYREFRPRYYIPSPERPLKQIGKTGDYNLIKEDGMWEEASQELKEATEDAQQSYQRLLEAGVAKEVSRFVLPQNTITSIFMTGNLRNWLFFLKGRLDRHAQEEIRDVAQMIYVHMNRLYPVTMDVAHELGIL